MKVSFIGGGNMGEAILSLLISRKIVKPADVCVGEVVETRRKYLKETYGVRVTDSNAEAAAGADVILLAIKPQTLPLAMPDLAGKLKRSQVVLSIIAGAKITTLAAGLQHDRIVRAMPNTPAQIGEGMAVWTATPQVTARQRQWAARILKNIGDEIFVPEEALLDAVTAVSGSGPAYFFLFIEALIGAAAEIGLERDMAKVMVLQTMLGSGHLVQHSDRTPAELREMVTSKGGTTAAALAVFEQGDFRGLVKRAVAAAYRRSLELGKSR